MCRSALLRARSIRASASDSRTPLAMASSLTSKWRERSSIFFSRNHYGHAAVKESKKIKLFELGAKGPGTDILDRAHPLVGIDDFLTDHEGHTEISPNTGAELLPAEAHLDNA